jgi:hypothetical protein
MIDKIRKQLVEDIAKGGRIFAPRRFGKTTACMQVLKENKFFIFLTKESEEESLKEEFPEVADRIFNENNIFNSKLNYRGKNLIVDESDWIFNGRPLSVLANHGITKVHALISSPDRRAVIYGELGERIELYTDSVFTIGS